jgi:AAHS family benzoate transporter-like MFS transporter
VTDVRAPSAASASRSGLTVVAICCFVVVFDGYDLIVYGASVPDLLAEPDWHLNPSRVGGIASWTLFGMLLGALSAGALTERLGRRQIVLIGITWFSIAMLACSTAPNPGSLTVLRFVAGLGLGGVIPSSIALTMEYAPRERRQLYNALMFAGYPVGGVIAASMARWLLADHGWRPLFALGAAPLVLVLPIAWRFLPESPGYLLSRGRSDEARAVAEQYGLDFEALRREHTASADNAGPKALFRPDVAVATVLFGAASFCGLLLVYGLNTWLPQLMRKAGYDLGDALSFLIVLNVGAVVGAVSASVLADRIGAKRASVFAFAAAVASLLVLTNRMDQGWLYLAVAVAGFGSVGTQILVNGFVGSYYPTRVRNAALGWSLGIGRAGAILGPTLGGWMLDAGFGFESNFYTFAAVAALGLLAIGFVPRPAAPTPAAPVPAKEEMPA